MKGWNKDGIPTLASLYDLELGYVGEDFLERGILNEGGEDAPAEEIAAEKE